MDVRAVLVQVQQGASNRRISRNLKIHRQTVKSYRQWAEAQGPLTGELPLIEGLQRLAKEALATSPPPQNRSSVEPHREVVEKLRDEGVEIAAIWQRLQERGYPGGYAAVWPLSGTNIPWQAGRPHVSKSPGSWQRSPGWRSGLS